MTIQEIAKLAGVSTATVSRVFNRQTGIKEEVRTKVLAAARTHGYHPRFSARQRNIVIIIPQEQSGFGALFLEIVQVFLKEGFHVEIIPVNDLKQLESIPFCGAVAVECKNSDFPNWAELFPVPLIIMDHFPASINPAEILTEWMISGNVPDSAVLH